MTIVSGYGFQSSLDISDWFKELTERNTDALIRLESVAWDFANLMAEQRQFRIVDDRDATWVKREPYDERYELFPWQFITSYTIEFDDEVTSL